MIKKTEKLKRAIIKKLKHNLKRAAENRRLQQLQDDTSRHNRKYRLETVKNHATGKDLIADNGRPVTIKKYVTPIDLVGDHKLAVKKMVIRREFVQRENSRTSRERRYVASLA